MTFGFRHRYLGLDELGGEPHVVVDGAARPASTLVLSHWPGSPTPPQLARDLSAEIAAAYCRDGGAWDERAEAVTNDHLDVDGLVSMFFLTRPGAALASEELLVEIARVGDFGVVRSIEAARTTWILETLMADPHLATVDLVDAAIGDHTAMTRTYRSLLQVLERYLDGAARYPYLYERREERFASSLERLRSGAATLVEHAEVDLAVIELAPGPDGATGGGDGSGIDPLAVHSSTDASRILVIAGPEVRYYDRYETWVRFVSRPRALRRNLAPLAAALSDADGAAWNADPPFALEPQLVPASGRSSIGALELIERVVEYLASAPVAWDPFADGRPLLR